MNLSLRKWIFYLVTISFIIMFSLIGLAFVAKPALAAILFVKGALILFPMVGLYVIYAIWFYRSMPKKEDKNVKH